MKHLRDWVDGERGRAVKLAAHLGVPPSFVSKMASGEKSIPTEHMAAIEVFTGGAVRRRDMCPRDWARIWPELAASQEGSHA